MWLKRVEIYGFKSFPERTILEFNPTLTGIVGPNGVGKSNIVDAIRWGLGEQSPRILRASTVEELIFGGNDKRKALGMAEVVLHFNNEDGYLSLPYQEVEITRRFFRSGESEYLINRKISRLKDIQLLFLGTGLGKGGYSFVGQGEIDLILSKTPEERRFLLEEAAGIARYRERKKSAEKKLAFTRENLLRVEDLLREVERQLNSLRYQARKVKRYYSFQEKLKEVEIGIAFFELKKEKEALELTEIKLRELEKKTKALCLSLEKKREEEKKLIFSIEELSRLIQEKEKEESKLQREEIERESRLSLWGERKKDLSTELEKEIPSFEEKEREIKKKLSSLEEEKEKLLKKKSLLLQEIAREEEEEVKIAKILKEKRNLLSKRRKEEIEMVNLIAHKRSEILILEKEIKEVEERIREGEKKEKDYREFERKVEEFILREEEEIKKEREKLRELKEKLKEASGRRKKEEASLSLLKEKVERLERRLLVLRGEERFSSFPGVEGMIKDILQVPPPLRRAVEAVLENEIFGLLATGEKNLEKILSFLEEKGERRTIWVLSWLKVEPLSPEFLSRIRTLTRGRLKDLVKYPPQLENLLEILLGRTVLVDNREKALEIKDKLYPLKVVTLEGELILPQGAVRGGEKPFSFSHEESLTWLEGELRKRKEELKKTGERLLLIENEVGSLEMELETRQRRLREREERLKERRGELRGIKEGEKEERKKIEELERTRSLLGEKLLSLKNFVKIEEEKKEKMEEGLTQLEKGLEEEELKRRKLTRERVRVYSDLRHLEIGLTEKEERKRALLSLQEELKERKKRREERKKEIAKGIKEYEEKEEEEKEILLELRGKREKIKEELSQLKKDLLLKRETLRGVKEEREEGKEKLREKEKELERALWERERREEKKEESLKKIKENHGMVDISSLPPPEESLEELLRKRKELIQGMESLGRLNFTALEDYEECKKRYNSIKLQREDLEKAKEISLKLIRELDRESKKRFLETLSKVNEHFNRIFQNVFGGGEAKLLLLDETNPLESGIEIMVKLPSKRLRSLSLLSGGERALTALSLIFAFMEVNPTPISILDEVDATLDDANSQRFARLLLEFSSRTQFILITHNKETLRVLKTLHGITMEEKGVSKVISVNMEELENV